MNVVLTTHPPSPSHPTVFFVTQIKHHVVLVKQGITIHLGYVRRIQKEERMEGVLLG
jgi:hypothetical protein